jgi:hypothetical protein
MANNYLIFSENLGRLTKCEEAWLREQLEYVESDEGELPRFLIGCSDEDDPERGFAFEFLSSRQSGRHLWLYAEESGKLRANLQPSRSVVRVFRCLASDLGETWLLRILRRDRSLITEKVMGESPDYLDRRNYFKRADLINGCYVVWDNLGGEVFRLDVSQFGA